MKQTIQFTQRKQKIQAIVAKSNDAFLKKIMNDKLGFDDDLRIHAYFELKSRGTIE